MLDSACSRDSLVGRASLELLVGRNAFINTGKTANDLRFAHLCAIGLFEDNHEDTFLEFRSSYEL